MLAAYLRGLLKPSTAYGFRSILFEDVIVEAMSAEISAQNFRLSITSDSALAAILSDESKRNVLRRTQRQIKRHASLQMMDIYEIANGRREKGGGRISLLQLFHLMRKEGIIHPDAAPTTTDSE